MSTPTHSLQHQCLSCSLSVSSKSTPVGPVIAAYANAYPNLGRHKLTVQSRGVGLAVSSLDLGQLE